MAERYYSKEEDLQHQAMAVNDMIRQLKGANQNPPEGFYNSRGGGGGGWSHNKGQPQRYRGQRGRNQHQPWQMMSSPQHRNAPQQRPPQPRSSYYQRPPQQRPSTHQRPPHERPPEQRPSHFQKQSYQRPPQQKSTPRRRSSANYWKEVHPEEYDGHMEEKYEGHIEEEYDGHIEDASVLKEQNSHRDDNVTSQDLVSSLANFPDFTASLLQLMEKMHINPSAVRSVASAYPHVFCLNDEKVNLKPKISVCNDHLSDNGCLNRSDCRNFHICPNFITNTCDNKDCFLGHSWKTNHNKVLLVSNFLDQISVLHLHKLFQELGSNSKGEGPLNICSSYNTDGCKRGDCKELHVCISFIISYTKCKTTDCQLNHDVLDQSCSHLLKAHGFSTNEAPRDITIALIAANPSLTEKVKAVEQEESSSSKASTQDVKQTAKIYISKEKDLTVSETKQKNDEDELSSGESEQCNTQESESELDTEEGESECDTEEGEGVRDTDKGVSDSEVSQCSDSVDSDTISMKDGSMSEDSIRKGKSNRRKRITVEIGRVEKTATKLTPQRTLWSHYPHGDALVPEICYYSVEGMCRNEGTGCQRLHATQHFHWQVSEQGNRWLNLRSAQVTCLECAFCDVAQDGVDLPRLDPSTVDYSAHGLLILMGRDTWHADFKSMNLTNSTDTKKLLIRRLHTENIKGQVIKATLFSWFFSDKNNKWVKYGNVDTAGQSNLVSSVTSDDIETHYLQNPSLPLTFKNSKFKYNLDFQAMEQTNQNTQVRREVRRRPECHLENETKSGEREKESEFPLTWDPMQPEERMKLVSLVPSSSEYQAVVNLLAGKLSSSSVTKVERVQNPFLWRALQNKIKEMTAVYGDVSKVDVRQVFHGTCHTVVHSICTENFDWRLHGSSSGQLYGRGTYFATDAKYSYNYCRADAAGVRYMFVARVAVGAITAGNSNMPRPPINTATKAPFDSTVDNVSNFTILVKYDKQEYYPEYILTLM